MSNKSAFLSAARSLGYRMGKRRGKGWVKNKEINFLELFQPEYAHEAQLGYQEGIAFEESCHTKDTWRTLGRD